MPELTFPTLDDMALDPWEWPAPPFAKWPAASKDEAPLPCTIEVPSGAAMQGELLAFDARARQLEFRARPDAAAVSVPFLRFARLTIDSPFRLLDGETREPYTLLPIAAQEREYRLERPAPFEPFAGKTMDHVEAEEGLYLFPPDSRQGTVQRVFVPRSAYTARHFGLSVEDAAAEHWVSTPQALHDALAAQAQQRVIPMGRALLQLGMATPEQIQQALAAPLGDMPLGERLVATGNITEADLHTVIAHKMGCPVVNLLQYPIDPAAVRKIPLQLALTYRVVPLAFDGDRLVLAMDRLQRLDELRERHPLSNAAPVLASRSHIKYALAGLTRQLDLWASSSSLHAGAFPKSPT